MAKGPICVFRLSPETCALLLPTLRHCRYGIGGAYSGVWYSGCSPGDLYSCSCLDLSIIYDLYLDLTLFIQQQHTGLQMLIRPHQALLGPRHPMHPMPVWGLKILSSGQFTVSRWIVLISKLSYRSYLFHTFLRGRIRSKTSSALAPRHSSTCNCRVACALDSVLKGDSSMDHFNAY